ncbi:MAG: cell division protein FtsA [Hyphomicrobiaceae bacterium]|nr:MAG: cell division protein FtsA [Hyphomicrobiaceae bacterium]
MERSMLRSRKIGRRDGAAALIDVGTSKVSTLIVELDRHGGEGASAPFRFPGRVLGFGYQRSRGVKAGLVVDLEEAEQAIRASVAQAERMAGINVKDVVVSVTCGRLKSRTFKAKVALDGRAASQDDIARILSSGRRHAERDGRAIVHLNRIGWRIDGAGGFEHVAGIKGDVLEADLHAVTADEPPLRNLLHAIERAFLDVSGMVAGPFASAIAATSPEERRLGVTVVDIGGGTTTIAMFVDGHFIHTDALAIGGGHITYDIARALGTPVTEAERIKTLYGGVFAAASDEHEAISYPIAGEDELSGSVSKAEIRRLVRSRAEHQVALLRDRLAAGPLAKLAEARVVLTGGACQLSGLCDLVANTLGRPVRIGRPYPLPGLPATVSNPAFSTVVGLAYSLLEPDAGVRSFEERDVLTGTGSYLERVGQWVRQSF